MTKKEKCIKYDGWCGVRTHADFRLRDLKARPLDHSGNHPEHKCHFIIFHDIYSLSILCREISSLAQSQLLLICFRIEGFHNLDVYLDLRKTFGVERRLSFLAGLWKVALAVCPLYSQISLVLVSRFPVLLTAFTYHCWLLE